MWGNNSTSGKFYIAQVPKNKLPKKRDQHITDTVEKGNSEQFDCTTLFFCLLFSGIDLLPSARRKELRAPPFNQSEYVDQLREKRNSVAHATTASLSNAEFREFIQEIDEIYRELQWNQTELTTASSGHLWPAEYKRLQQKVDVEKARIDDHERRLSKVERMLA